LERRYGPERLEAACRRALALGSANLKTIRSILQHGLDRQEPPAASAGPTPGLLLEHINIRGAHYYN
jgi:hypothetical protein